MGFYYDGDHLYANAWRTISADDPRSRIDRVLRDYLAAVRAGSVAADHSLLRKLGALCDRLPSLKSDGAFEEAFLRDYNDALAAAFLATATKNAAAVNDLSDKFVLVNARGSKLV